MQALHPLSLIPHAYCHWCGSHFPENMEWPKICLSCSNTSYRNPSPVAVVLVPVIDQGRTGLLLVRRNIEPCGLALPGGFVEFAEDWKDAAQRELFEETGIKIKATAIRDFRTLSAPDGTVLIFGLTEAIDRDESSQFAANPEANGTEVVYTSDERIVFPLHKQVVDMFLYRSSFDSFNQ